MDFETDDFLPLSGLQHYVFCRRQCALIHVEGTWSENALTASGRVLHEKVHGGDSESRPGVRIARSVPLRSERLRLTGLADVVEFLLDERGPVGHARPYPVEHKRGRQGRWVAAMVQLCAQGMCLEEMLGRPVPAGAIYFGASHRRREVAFSEALRALTERTAREFHEMVARGETPPPEFSRKCANCSLKDACMPEVASRPGLAAEYVARALREADVPPERDGGSRDVPPSVGRRAD